MIKTCIVILHLGKIVGAFCMPNVDMVECRAAIDEREALRPGLERAGFDADAVTLDTSDLDIEAAFRAAVAIVEKARG